MTIRERPRPHLWIWFLWLALFFSAWSVLVFAMGHLPTALAHWPMAAAMAVGSYAAGSTPMGGGTAGFPILALFAVALCLVGFERLRIRGGDLVAAARGRRD